MMTKEERVASTLMYGVTKARLNSWVLCPVCGYKVLVIMDELTAGETHCYTGDCNTVFLVADVSGRTR